MKILVVYYSNTGYTRTLAEQIAQASGADLEPIKESGNRRGVTGYLRSVLQGALHLDVAVRPPVHNPADYDLVVIGTPIWGWNMSSPVRAYIQKNRGHFPRVALFCTFGGSGKGKVLDDMEQLCGKPVALTLAVTTAQIQSGLYDDSLLEFVTALQETRPRKRASAGASGVSNAPAH